MICIHIGWVENADESECACVCERARESEKVWWKERANEQCKQFVMWTMWNKISVVFGWSIFPWEIYNKFFIRIMIKQMLYRLSSLSNNFHSLEKRMGKVNWLVCHPKPGKTIWFSNILIRASSITRRPHSLKNCPVSNPMPFNKPWIAGSENHATKTKFSKI